MPPAWLIKLGIGLALLAVLGFAVNWLDNSRQKVGYDRAMAEVTKRENESLKFALAEMERLNNQVAEAQRHAKEREAENQVLADRINDLSGRLRNTQHSINTLVSTATADALRKATTAFNALFEECRAKYDEMGKAAAGHSSDVITLEEACRK